MKPKKRPRTIGIAQSTQASTPVEGVDPDEDGTAAAASNAEAVPVIDEVIRKEAYIACTSRYSPAMKVIMLTNMLTFLSYIQTMNTKRHLRSSLQNGTAT